MKKKAYISPETEVVKIKIENLMNVTVSGEGITADPNADESNPDNPGYEDPRSRRRNVWEEEEEEDW